MFEQISSFSLILSLIVGLITGLIFGIKWKQPQNWYGFTLGLIIIILSPSIGTSVYLIGEGTIYATEGVVLSPFLFSTLLIVNMLFIYRLIADRKPAKVKA